VVREPRRPLDDETPTVAIPVGELLNRLRAEQGGESPPLPRSPAHHRRAAAGPLATRGQPPRQRVNMPTARPSFPPPGRSSVRRAGSGLSADARPPGPVEQVLEEPREPLPRSEDADHPAESAPEASEAPVGGERAVGGAGGRAVSGVGGKRAVSGDGRARRGTASSTLWLVLAIAVLFAAAALLLAVTVRGLCVAASDPGIALSAVPGIGRPIPPPIGR